MGCRHTVALITLVVVVLLSGLPVGAVPFRFDAARLFEAGEDPRSQVLADFDGDGALDLATVNDDTVEIAILLGTGDGSFAPPLFVPLPYEPTHVVAGDLDNDGDDDLAVSAWWDGVVMVLLNDGAAGFTVAASVPAGPRPLRMVLADLDGDGILDLVVANDDGLAVMLNQGDGSFTPAVTWYAGDNPGHLAVGDVTGDGVSDLLAGNFLVDEYYYFYDYWGEVWILPGLGDGSFGAPAYFTTEYAISDMVLGDLDGDGVFDLVTLESNYAEGMYLIRGDLVQYRGLGGGGFGPAVEVRRGLYGGLDSADLDGDGLLDLVCRDADRGLQVMRGLPGGEFAEPLLSNPGVHHEYLVFGKLDGDEHLDLAARMGFDVGVLRGKGDCRFHDIEVIDGSGGTYSLDLVDLDQDGDLDALTACGLYLVAIFENLGDGVFALPVFHGAAAFALQALAADLDGDGILDLAVVREADSCLAVFRGTGGLEYAEPEYYSFGSEGRSIAASDLDGDGRIDLVLATDEEVLILQGDGAGGVEWLESYSTGLEDENQHVTIADLDGDGIAEIAMVSYNNYPRANHLTLFPGLGDGAFGSPASYPVPHFAAASSAGDLDNDGHTDLVVPSRGEGPAWKGTVQVFYGNGDGTLADPVAIPAGRQTNWAAVIQFDNDGVPDLASVSTYSGDVRAHFGNGSGAFDAWESYSAGQWPHIAALGDIDQDGDMDVVTDAVYGGGITILRNRTVAGGSTRGWLVTGPGPGQMNPPAVRLYAVPEPGGPAMEWTAYGAEGYGTNVAAGDLDGNGVPEILTGPGPGEIYGPHVRAFRLDGSAIPGFDFMAYGTLRYGVNVAAGELDGQTAGSEFITGAGPGPVFGPHVRGWSWDGTGPVEPVSSCSFFAYGTPKWGVNVACGNLDGNDLDEIITGAGPGTVYGPHVRAFTPEGTAIPEVSFFAYGTLQYGVKVACGDIDGDGFDEIVTGPGPGPMFAPHVRGWNWDGDGVVQPIEALNFLAHAEGWWGVNVSCADLDGDGIDEILTGRGPDPALDGRVRGWNYDGDVLEIVPGIDFLAWEKGIITHGATVAGVDW